MGLFGLFKKKEWDIEKSDENKKQVRALFNNVMKDGDTWNVVYGYSTDIKNSNYILARKTTYEFTSLIIGYRESDMSIALIQTTPELDGCSDPEIFTKDGIKRAGMSFGEYVIYHKGGIMAGYTKFSVDEGNDEDYLAYIYQPEELQKFDIFFKEYSKK